MSSPTSRYVQRGLVVAVLAVASSLVARVGHGAELDLRSLTLVPEAVSIDEGATTAFVVIGTYANGERKLVTNKVTWSSSDRSVATVAKDGTTAGITYGKATIKALLNAPAGRIQAEAALTVQPRLTSLSLEPQSTTLVPGESYRFQLRGGYSDGTVQILSDKAHWSVDEGGAATIDANGNATGVRRGTALIVAAVGSLRAMARVRVGVMPALAVQPTPHPHVAGAPPPKPTPSPSASSASSKPAYVTSVTIQPATGSLPEQQTQRLAATGHYSDGTVRDITQEAVWASTDVQVARVGTDGTVYGVHFGTATIAGTLETFSGVATLTVTPIIVRIALLPEALTIKHHADGRLSSEAIWSDDTRSDITEATWTSSDEGIASISSGSVQGNSPGSATITIALDDFRTSAAITVEPVLQSIAVQPQSASLTIGQAQQLTAVATYSDGSTKDVTYNVRWSHDTRAVSVSPTGLATAHAEGAGTITARWDSVVGAATITVSKPPG